jgi:LemA protein
MIGVLIFLAVIAAVIFWVIGMYNRLIALRNRIENAWSQIDVQLKRRVDLIPNLVETVKGYAAHEKETFERVIQARSALVNAGGDVKAQGEADAMLTGALKSLFAVAEAYPDLKANQNFLNLQEELTSAEDRVAYARQFYNDSVLSYNTQIQKFPTVLLAGWFHFEKREFFDAAPEDTETPQVQF